MKIVFARDVLLANLTPVMGTVTTKNTITSLEGVLIETLGGDTVRFTTYDMNKGTRTTFEAVEVIEEGSYVIPANRLMQIVRVMNEGEITIEVDDRLTVHITGGASDFTMFAINGTDFPGLPELSGNRSFSVPCAVLRDAVGRVMHSVAEFDNRPVLCGAYFRVSEGRLEVVSCDSYTLSRCVVRCDVRDVEAGDTPAFSFILPGHALTELQKMLPDKGEETVRIFLAPKHAILRFGGIEFFTRMIEGQYIDYERIMPKEQPITVVVSRERLLAGLERALLIADEKIAGSGKSYVKLAVRGDILSLNSTSSNGRVYDEMPCVHEGDDLIIGFNCRYLINSVRAANTEEIRIGLKSAQESLTMVAAKENPDDDYFYLVLPVRMND